MDFIDLKTQYYHYKEEINAAIQHVLDHGGYIMGPEVQQLEQELARYVDGSHCSAVASGTDALVIALMALGVGPGDEVITVPYSFIASATSIALVGATPVFVDIEPETFNIDVNQIEAAITPKTKAIVPVSVFGQMPDLDAINKIADRHGLAVLEDAAQSFGATRNGHKSCNVATVSATSFFPAKPLGCYGDGGAIFTNDDALAARIRAIRNHGGEQRYQHELLGLNGRCDTIQAAILRVKLKYFDEELRRRQEAAERYHRLLTAVCTTPITAKGNTHTWAQYTLRAPNRDQICAALKEADIPSAVYYPTCIHQQPVFQPLGYEVGDFPISEQAAQEVFSIPMHPWLTEEQQNAIAEIVNEQCAAYV